MIAAHRRRLGDPASTPPRALALGFVADASFDAIIAAHVEDELGGADRLVLNAMHFRTSTLRG